MFIILTYDIENSSIEGKKRLRKVAKICENYGVRVQNSVFELDINNGDLIKLKNELRRIILCGDSIKIYKLGNNYKNDIEVLGKEEKLEISSNSSFII